MYRILEVVVSDRCLHAVHGCLLILISNPVEVSGKLRVLSYCYCGSGGTLHGNTLSVGCIV